MQEASIWFSIQDRQYDGHGNAEKQSLVPTQSALTAALYKLSCPLPAP